MKVTVKVEGLRSLKAALDELPKATARNIMLRVLKQHAEPIASAARQLAPVDTGDLKRSIRVLARKTGGDAGKAAFAEAMRSGASRAEAGQAARAANRSARNAVLVLIGPGRQPQAIMQEFGTEHHPAQPFMRPAWDRYRDDLLPSIGKAMWDEIEAAARRRARKLAKAAAKGT
jgi:HK97 gp10 family phage protein